MEVAAPATEIINPRLPDIEHLFVCYPEQAVLIMKWQFHAFWREYELLNIIMDYLYDFPQQCVDLAQVLDSMGIVYQVTQKHTSRVHTRTIYRDWLLQKVWAPRWGIPAECAGDVLEIMKHGTRCVDCCGLLHDRQWLLTHVPKTTWNGYNMSKTNRSRAARKSGKAVTLLPDLQGYFFLMRDYAEDDGMIYPPRCFECLKTRVDVIPAGDVRAFVIKNLALPTVTKKGFSKRKTYYSAVDEDFFVRNIVDNLHHNRHYQYGELARLNFGKEVDTMSYAVGYPVTNYVSLEVLRQAIEKMEGGMKTGDKWKGCVSCGGLCLHCANASVGELLDGARSREDRLIRGCFSNAIPWPLSQNPLGRPIFTEYTYNGPFRKRIAGSKRKTERKPRPGSKKKKIKLN